MGVCKNAPASCECVEHAEGLLAHAQDRDAFLRALKAFYVKPVRLGVVKDTREGCDGSMTCVCGSCRKERAELLRRGGTGSGAHQPWEPRRAA